MIPKKWKIPEATPWVLLGVLVAGFVIALFLGACAPNPEPFEKEILSAKSAELDLNSEEVSVWAQELFSLTGQTCTVPTAGCLQELTVSLRESCGLDPNCPQTMEDGLQTLIDEFIFGHRAWPE